VSPTKEPLSEPPGVGSQCYSLSPFDPWKVLRPGLDQRHNFVGAGDAPAPGIYTDVDLPAGLQPTLVDMPVDQPFTGVYWSLRRVPQDVG
jgi:hypothetical protein